MTSRAHAEFDPHMFGVRLALRRDLGSTRQYIKWEQPVAVTATEGDAAREPDDSVWLRLPEEDARAIYDALADHFGHAGHDARALRKDYDAERGRVDRLITHLTKER